MFVHDLVKSEDECYAESIECLQAEVEIDPVHHEVVESGKSALDFDFPLQEKVEQSKELGSHVNIDDHMHRSGGYDHCGDYPEVLLVEGNLLCSNVVGCNSGYSNQHHKAREQSVFMSPVAELPHYVVLRRLTRKHEVYRPHVIDEVVKH